MTKSKRPSSRRKRSTAPEPAPDPTSDAALLALPPSYARLPDIPVDVARRELSSLARLATACAEGLAAIGIDAATIERAARFATVLARKQKDWLAARKEVPLRAKERKWLEQAEQLDAKLVAGGRWAMRRDPEALAELARISEGSGLTDTLQDLRDLMAFWQQHEDALAQTLITERELAKAATLVQRLEPAAHKEADDVAAARAQDLRNRAFWAAHELAQEIREGGRYVYGDEPKMAAKFRSRHRAATVRRSRRKARVEAREEARDRTEEIEAAAQ